MAAVGSSSSSHYHHQQQQLTLVTNGEEHWHSGAADEWKEYLPLGFRFRPTDEELILQYLEAKVSRRYITPGIIADVNVYLHEPQNLKRFAFENGDERMYFFSPVKRKDSSKVKNERTVLNKGYWKASTAKRSVPEGSRNPIGLKASFVYYSFENSNNIKVKRKQNWLMQEFRLPDKESDDPEEFVVALCVVYYYKKSKGQEE